MRREDGFSLIEVLVAIALFSVLAVGFYTVMFSQVTGSERTRSVVRMSEEARLGFNRMVRDTREGTALAAESGCAPGVMEAGECFNVKVDFDGDGIFENPNGAGDYENLTFAYDADDSQIDMLVCTSTGCAEETLIAGVSEVPGKDLFSFSSNLLAYDANDDGETTWQELDDDPVIGDNDGLDDNEWQYLSSVGFALRIEGEEDGESEEFFTQAQLRNRRFGQ